MSYCSHCHAKIKRLTAWGKSWRDISPVVFYTFFFLLRVCFVLGFFYCSDFFFQQLLRNCSMSISCVHKCCTVGLTAADPQLPSYRNCFFLSVSILPVLYTLADLPKHCVEGWSGACMCVIFWENAAAVLLENKAAIQDTRSCFFTKHILFSRCLGLNRPVKCTLQCYSRLSSQLIAASGLLC